MTGNNTNMELLQAYQTDNIYLRRAIDIEERMGSALQERLNGQLLELRQRDGTIAALQTQLGQRDETVAALREQLGRQRLAMGEKDQLLTALREELAQMRLRNEAELTAAKMQIKSYEDSTIWRMTAPIRKVLDFLKRFGRENLGC